MSKLEKALETLGESLELRNTILEMLAEAEKGVTNQAKFRYEVRWPIIEALIGNKSHHVILKNGLQFEVCLQSRIEKSLLLTLDAPPDHIWEPQTTRLACVLARDCANVIVGGAYIGDQALPVAQVLQTNGRNGFVFTFEPNPNVFKQLVRHIEINDLKNVRADQRVLWNHSGINLELQGGPALTSAFPDVTQQANEEVFTVATVTIDEYMQEHRITEVGLIMLDTEGAEETVLAGAQKLLGRQYPSAPHIIFEVYNQDWSEGLANVPLVKWLRSFDYEIFAIRDFQGNLSMADRPLEIIPLKDVYIANVPHGFNVLATKDKGVVEKYGLTLVRNLSPKLLSQKDTTLPYPPKDPAMHLPSDGLGLELF